MILAHYTTDESNYNECLKRGTIVPTKDWYGKKLFAEDFLAGDHKYVFLLVNERYVALDEDGEDNSFGFILDAESLVEKNNALVGPDLLNEYRVLLNECATHTVLQSTTLKNVQLLIRGILAGDTNEPGVTETVLLFRERATELQNERRCRGEAALKLLQESSEPLELLVNVAAPPTDS